MKGLTTPHYQKQALVKYDCVGVGHLRGLPKWNCSTDGTRLSTKDIQNMSSLARNYNTRHIKALRATHQVTPSETPHPFH